MTEHSDETVWRLLDARDISLRRARAEIARKEAKIARLAAQAQAVSREAAERQRMIESLTAEAQERQGMIESLTAEAQERQGMIESLTAESVKRQKMIEELTAESEVRLRLIERLHDEMAAQEQRGHAAGPQVSDGQTNATGDARARVQAMVPGRPGAPSGIDAQAAVAGVRVALTRLRESLSGGVGLGSLPEPGFQAGPEAVLAGLEQELAQLERAIEGTGGGVRRYAVTRRLRSVREFVSAWTRRLRVGLSPRLGRLHQHPRLPLRQIRPYVCAASPAELPVISLVTPSFRQGAYIEKTLLSVLNQGYPRVEYLVQDGGSDDNTVSVLERYADRLTHWESRPDQGQADAINRGFARTTGEVMGWLNSDDLLLPGALACVGDYFARRPEIDVVYGNRVVINEADMEVGRWVLPAHDDEVLSWADFVPQETLFWRRPVWVKAGGKVDTSYEFALDWELLVRFRAAGARFVHIPRFLAAFRVHPRQKTSTAIDDVGFAEMNRIRQRVHGHVPSQEEINHAVRPYLIRHVAVHLLDSLSTKVR